MFALELALAHSPDAAKLHAGLRARCWRSLDEA